MEAGGAGTAAVIRLDRGNEPAALKKIRSEELKRVGAIAEVADPTSDDIGDRYKVVRRTLWERQDYKCCFCEFRERHEYSDVEHYRPKAEVQRIEKGPVAPGYWWLAWTWANLMFACQACNRSYKRTLFPLDDDSIPLGKRQPPPGREKPLLIDPFTEDPIDHIQFRLSRIGSRLFWLPFARNVSKKGSATIRITGLACDTLRTLYQVHHQNFIAAQVRALEQALAIGPASAIRETWREATGILLNRQQAFVGLSHDVLDAHFPETVRLEHGLFLPRP